MLNDKTVLVVDDESLIRDILGDFFAWEKARVLKAENGVDAMETIRREKVDVVITDARMPGGDGIALVRAIATLPPPRPLVFLCSGFNDLPDAEAKRLGVLERFPKPFDLMAVRAALKKHLGCA